MEGFEIKFFFGVYDWVMITQLIAISASLVGVFRHFQLKVKALLRSLLHCVIIFAIGTLLNYALFELSHDVKILGGVNFPLAWLITIILYLAFFSTIPVANRFIMGSTLFVSVITITELGHDFAMVLVNNGIGHARVVENIVYVLEPILIIAFAAVMKKFSLSKYTDIPRISAVLIFINSTVMAGEVFVNTRLLMRNIEMSREMYCIVLLGNYILVVTGYMMIWFHCKVRREITELEVENRLLEADNTMMLLSEKAIEDMNCLRHDIKNQCQVMKMLLEDGKYNELNEYFDSMNINESLRKGYRVTDCGNNLLNSIINMENMKAASMGVDFTTKVSVTGEINIQQSDLCRILVNLIDNAMEAVERYNTYDRPVDCKISNNKDYLYICVRNAIGSEENKKEALSLVSTKANTTLHGYGHRIVDKLVNKYQGHIKYSVEEDEFIAEAMLSLTAELEG